MSQRTLDAHYQPNWRLTRAHGLIAYNCGYAKTSGEGSFASHQQSLVWQLLGDTPIGQDSVVLDVGCGIGGPAGWIMDRCGPLRIIGLEYLGSSVRAAEHIWSGRTHRPSFIQGDAHHIPLGDASVDVVFNLESALHYPDKPAFLSECRRVLKPGGTLCLGDITSRYKALFAPTRLINPIPIQFNSNLHLWRTQEYLDALPDLGFNVLSHEDASLLVARSLADGLEEIKQRGWRACRGFRGRAALLAVMELLLRKSLLTYDLFRARRGDG